MIINQIGEKDPKFIKNLILIKLLILKINNKIKNQNDFLLILFKNQKRKIFELFLLENLKNFFNKKFNLEIQKFNMKKFMNFIRIKFHTNLERNFKFKKIRRKIIFIDFMI